MVAELGRLRSHLSHRVPACDLSWAWRIVSAINSATAAAATATAYDGEASIGHHTTCSASAQNTAECSAVQRSNPSSGSAIFQVEAQATGTSTPYAVY